MQRSKIVPTAYIYVQTEAMLYVRQQNSLTIQQTIIGTHKMEVSCTIKLENYII